MATPPIPSRMSILGHPIHPMLIHLPVAALLGLVASDLTYIFTEDYFWARASLWLAGVGAFGGWFAGAAGLVDLATVAGIRRLITSWCHAIVAVMLLSIATFNWLMRLNDASEWLQPWGLFLSILAAVLIALASVLGGQLVYDHGVGVEPES